MCGISGIASRKKDYPLTPVIRQMNDAMEHRGPDSDGFFVEDDIALGHRRLSIIDLSDAANQPYYDNSRRYVMVFNGELYNFREIRSLIKDYDFKTNSDTEVIIAAYAKWGKACLEHFKGMFAFAIWDNQERELFIVRDRMGVKPLYYHFDGEHLLFASEIRSIISGGKVKKKLNKVALFDYLSYQSSITPHTLVEGIIQLPSGSFLLFKNGKLQIETYWDITRRSHEEVGTDIKVIHNKIRDLLFSSVERRLVSDVPLGAFLSGGIDSSAVVAIMSKVNSQQTNAFTIGFEEKEFDESPYADLVAKKYNVHHTKVLLKANDFLTALPNALNAMDTPSGDGVNTYVVSKAIKASCITVALSGIGGDELFAGYPIFSQFKKLKQREGLIRNSKLLRRTAASFIPASNQRFERIKALLAIPSAGIEDIYPFLRQIQTRTQIRRLTHLPEIRQDTLQHNLAVAGTSIRDFPELSQVSIADYMGYTQHVLLKDTDQMSMASSLEVREPFFDHDLVQYVLNIPDAFKTPTYPKSLLVESIKPLLPDEIVFRKKQGFVLPYDIWIRNELKSFCEAKIQQLAMMPSFNEGALMQYWGKFLEHKDNIRWTDIWILIVLGNWIEKNQIEE